jgi:hypothetical protein
VADRPTRLSIAGASASGVCRQTGGLININALSNSRAAVQASLAVFRPSRLLGFTWEEEDRDWDPAKVAEMSERTKQRELFEEHSWRETFKVIPKLPYSFSYQFEDAAGRTSDLQVLDWEVGALYWNCLNSAEGDEAAALAKVRQKYFDEFGKTDLHFFLGTMQQFHFIAPNPWVIVGVFPAPRQTQPLLFGPEA